MKRSPPLLSISYLSLAKAVPLAVALAAGAVVLGAAIVSSGPAIRHREGTIDRATATEAIAGNDIGELHATIREWDVPTRGAHPHDPAVGMDGALWFTEQMQNKIGRLDPASGAFKEFPLKVDISGPH